MSDKPLAVEYKGKKRLFAYEVFKKLKYGVTETNQNIQSEYSNKEQSGDNNSSSKEDAKEEKKSEFDESDKSNIRNMQERNDPHTLYDISLLCKEIKGLRDDIKVWMERLIAPLNTIANHIEKNKGIGIEFQNPSNSILVITQNIEIPQSEVIIHKIEDYEAIRGQYSYEIFIKEKLSNLNSNSKKEYSKVLSLSGNIGPLAYFLYANSYLSLQTMKSFVVTWKEYYKNTESLILRCSNLFLSRKIWNNWRQKKH